VKTAIISLSEQGARVAERLSAHVADSRIYLHADVRALPQVDRFDRIADLTRDLFAACRGLIFIAPTGLVVRAIAPCIRHKLSDPAVVVVDVGGRWAISLLSGHEGGANDLAMTVANVLDAEPVVTTTTEAVKTVIVGIGCRRGTGAGQIVEAVRQALARANRGIEQVRLLASADLKADEPGLLDASRQLNVPLRLVSGEEIRQCSREFERSEFVQSKVNLPAVAEPSALLAGRRTRLLLTKQIFENVTVAVAAENCSWSE
jgi:cobalt-precorrin 5A hydrolase